MKQWKFTIYNNSLWVLLRIELVERKIYLSLISFAVVVFTELSAYFA